MKYALATLLVLFAGFQELLGQGDHRPRDIEDAYVLRLMSERDTTWEAQFRNFALKLFMRGTTVNDEVLRSGRNFVGVGVQRDTTSLDQEAVAFNLIAVTYRDTREKDFHRKIYFPGFEGMASFFLICNNADERSMFNGALRSYLVRNTIPVDSMAYKFMLEHWPEEELFGRLFDSDGRSKVVVGPTTYSYLRRNGNFLIHIQGVPDVALADDVKDLYVTDHFIENWYTISVFPIDERSGKAYNIKFK